MPKIEEDGKSWLRKPKLYKGVVEPYKKKKKISFLPLAMLNVFKCSNGRLMITRSKHVATLRNTIVVVLLTVLCTSFISYLATRNFKITRMDFVIVLMGCREVACIMTQMP